MCNSKTNAPKFQVNKVYQIVYRTGRNERSVRHFNYNFYFVGECKGDGVTHYTFCNTTGNYNISFTELDFITGDVQAKCA